jgi:thiol-disulfide isomerase/thioredoxin
MSQAIQLGPLSFPMTLLLLLFGIGLAWGVGKWLARKGGIDVEPALFRALLIGVVCARLAFVWQYRVAYLSEPLTILDIRDGGWEAQAGFIGAWLYAVSFTRTRKPMRSPMLAAMAAASVAWMVGSIALAMNVKEDLALPGTRLPAFEGGTASLLDFSGKPTVVNLWATWCGPCQREMPVLQRAQVDHPEVHFVFLNQGESSGTVRGFLAAQNLPLRNVLLDAKGEVSAKFSQQALPTTLFFDAAGHLTSTRIGELSQATLTQRLDALASSNPNQAHATP